jgi:hypothetical protein
MSLGSDASMKGSLPVAIKYKRAPILQRSVDFECGSFLRISGAVELGLLQYVCTMTGWNTFERPNSTSFILSSQSRSLFSTFSMDNRIVHSKDDIRQGAGTQFVESDVTPDAQQRRICLGEASIGLDSKPLERGNEWKLFCEYIVFSKERIAEIMDKR